MKHVKLFEQYMSENSVHEASKKMPNIQLKDWQRTGEDASDGQVWVVAEYKGKYFIATADPEPGSVSGIESVDLNYMEEISKKEYEDYV